MSVQVRLLWSTTAAAARRQFFLHHDRVRQPRRHVPWPGIAREASRLANRAAVGRVAHQVQRALGHQRTVQRPQALVGVRTKGCAWGTIRRVFLQIPTQAGPGSAIDSCIRRRSCSAKAEWIFYPVG